MYHRDIVTPGYDRRAWINDVYPYAGLKLAGPSVAKRYGLFVMYSDHSWIGNFL